MGNLRRPNMDRMRKVNERSFEPPPLPPIRIPDLSGYAAAIQSNRRDLAQLFGMGWYSVTTGTF